MGGRGVSKWMGEWQKGQLSAGSMLHLILPPPLEGQEGHANPLWSELQHFHTVGTQFLQGDLYGKDNILNLLSKASFKFKEQSL